METILLQKTVTNLQTVLVQRTDIIMGTLEQRIGREWKPSCYRRDNQESCPGTENGEIVRTLVQ
jgi:hypothetical protein